MSECLYKYATIDIETTGLNRYKDKITWIGVGLSNSVEEYELKNIDGINMLFQSLIILNI